MGEILLVLVGAVAAFFGWQSWQKSREVKGLRLDVDSIARARDAAEKARLEEAKAVRADEAAELREREAKAKVPITPSEIDEKLSAWEKKP